MDTNSKIINSYSITQSKSSDLCLIDPMILMSIIIVICLTLYVIGYKLSKQDMK